MSTNSAPWTPTLSRAPAACHHGLQTRTPSQLDPAAQATAMWPSTSTRPLLDVAAVGDNALQPSLAALSRRIEDIADYMRRLAAQARGRRATMPYAICYDWLTLLLSNVRVSKPPSRGGEIHTTRHTYSHLLTSHNATSSSAPTQHHQQQRTMCFRDVAHCAHNGTL